MVGQRKFRILTIGLSLVILVIPLGFEPQSTFGAPNTTWYVNTTADHDDGSCANKSCTLREAINLATSGDTIEFTDLILPGTITMDDTLGEFTIDKDLTIRNTDKVDDLTISGNDLTRIFHVDYNDSLTIGNLILTQGISYGSAVWNEQ
jgi:CSLREA domain-containing protein